MGDKIAEGWKEELNFLVEREQRSDLGKDWSEAVVTLISAIGLKNEGVVRKPIWSFEFTLLWPHVVAANGMWMVENG